MSDFCWKQTADDGYGRPGTCLWEATHRGNHVFFDDRTLPKMLETCHRCEHPLFVHGCRGDLRHMDLLACRYPYMRDIPECGCECTQFVHHPGHALLPVGTPVIFGWPETVSYIDEYDPAQDCYWALSPFGIIGSGLRPTGQTGWSRFYMASWRFLTVQPDWFDEHPTYLRPDKFREYLT